MIILRIIKQAKLGRILKLNLLQIIQNHRILQEFRISTLLIKKGEFFKNFKRVVIYHSHLLKRKWNLKIQKVQPLLWMNLLEYSLILKN